MSGADADTVREALRVQAFHSLTMREFDAVAEAPAALDRLVARVAEAEKALRGVGIEIGDGHGGDTICWCLEHDPQGSRTEHTPECLTALAVLTRSPESPR